MVEDAIAQTAVTATDLLFDEDGKPKGHDHFLALYTLSTILRPTTASEAPAKVMILLTGMAASTLMTLASQFYSWMTRIKVITPLIGSFAMQRLSYW